MIKYTIAMSIRVLCIFAMLFAQGWWLAVFAAGAIFLPYVAVVLANVSGPTRNPQVLRPGGLVPTTPPTPAPEDVASEAPENEAAAEPETESEPAAAQQAQGSEAHAVPPRDERGAA